MIPTMASTATQPAARREASGKSRSEEHTSELQSQSNLVCRLLLEKKKKEKHSTQILRKYVNQGTYASCSHTTAPTVVVLAITPQKQCRVKLWLIRANLDVPIASHT